MRQKLINQVTLLVNIVFGLYLSFLSTELEVLFTYVFFHILVETELGATSLTVNSTDTY